MGLDIAQKLIRNGKKKKNGKRPNYISFDKNKLDKKTLCVRNVFLSIWKSASCRSLV